MIVSLTDAELQFSATPKGRNLVARAKAMHDACEAHKGPKATPWTDGMEASAVRSLSAQEARTGLISAVRDATAPTAIANARVARDAAHAALKDTTRNAWRKPS